MQRAVEHDVLVHLVGQDHDVGAARELREPREIVARQHGRGRVVRRVDDDHARARRDRGRDLVPVHAEILGRQLDRDRRRALHAHDRRVAVERRLEIDDLVARMHERADRRVEPFARARDHGDLGRRIVTGAVQRLGLLREPLAQRRDAGHRRVLVVAVAHRARDALDERRIRREIRRALRQVQRVVLRGELADHGKDRRADVGQFRTGCSGASHVSSSFRCLSGRPHARAACAFRMI